MQVNASLYNDEHMRQGECKILSQFKPLSLLSGFVCRLILSQFRFLNFLVDSHSMTEKLLEILSICPFALKKEIITFLPEVIVDSEHEMVVRALEQLLQARRP